MGVPWMARPIWRSRSDPVPDCACAPAAAVRANAPVSTALLTPFMEPPVPTNGFGILQPTYATRRVYPGRSLWVILSACLHCIRSARDRRPARSPSRGGRASAPSPRPAGLEPARSRSADGDGQGHGVGPNLSV
ncbi:protein of unknown function [Stenotrophomonas maltophilia]|nr:protein of unknown function [Stenotrophomonas maltophilia]